MNEQNQSLALHSPHPIAAIHVERLLDKAVDAKSAVEVIQALNVMRREVMAEQAKAAYDAAFAAFQAECPPIVKQKGVTDNSGNTAYKYAPLEDVIAQIKPILQRHGFSYTLDTDVTSADGWVIAKCRINHAAGHSTESVAKFPLGGGTRMMSTTQIYASALTFASRRVLCNAFGLVMAGEDSDGRIGKAKPAGPSTMAAPDPALKQLAAALWGILAPVRGEKKNWEMANQWLWKNDVLDGAVPEVAPNLTAEKFGEVINKAKAILNPQ